MRPLDHKFYSDLRDVGSIVSAKVPKRIKASVSFKNLIQFKIIEFEKSGRGSKLNVKDSLKFEQFYGTKFPAGLTNEISKANNIKSLRNSKARQAKTEPIFLLRGFGKVVLDGKEIDLGNFTNRFGLFGVRKPQIETEKICFVENLEPFLKAEKLFGSDFIYMHKYGRIGKESLTGIKAKDILMFVDFDLNGLAEYLRVKKVFSQTKLYVPANYDELHNKYSCEMKKKQKIHEAVRTSTEPSVVKIREQVLRENRFLEQEILIHD